MKDRELSDRTKWQAKMRDASESTPDVGARVFFITRHDTWYGFFSGGKWWSLVRPTLGSDLVCFGLDVKWCYEEEFTAEDRKNYNTYIQDLDFVYGKKSTAKGWGVLNK